MTPALFIQDKMIVMGSKQDMYKYFAFISYSAKDRDWGWRIQKKLEGYRMPSTMCDRYGWKRKPMNPIFFAPTDIQPGELSAELQERLKASRNLIVICSPNSAKSKWVGKEIEFFHSIGRTGNIHFFIVDGEPHSINKDIECFNPVIENLGIPEILGANVHEKISFWPWINRERAYVQLITKLLGVEFDSIWQRHKRLFVQKCAACFLGAISVFAIVFGVWTYNQPVDINIKLNESSPHNENLPPLKDAVVSITLNNEIKADTIPNINTPALFVNIPHKEFGKKARITVNCINWFPTDTTIILSKDMSVNVARDPHPYGDIVFKLWNTNEEKTYPYAPVLINGFKAVADSDGRVLYTIPLAEQDTVYVIESHLPLSETHLKMPTTGSTIITVQ